jgi:hypothetical protein
VQYADRLSRTIFWICSFNGRNHRYLIFSTISQHSIEEHLDFFATFVLIPCKRSPITQYVQLNWVAHCNMYNHTEKRLCAIICLYEQGYWILRPIVSELYILYGYIRKWDKTMKVRFVFISLITCHLYMLLLVLEQLLIYVFSNPSHILCLTLANGWNKEPWSPKLKSKLHQMKIFPFCFYLSSSKACLRIHSMSPSALYYPG